MLAIGSILLFETVTRITPFNSHQVANQSPFNSGLSL